MFTDRIAAYVLFATTLAGIASTGWQFAGKKGGLKGGKSRMDALSEEQRTALAMKGVAARKNAPAGETGALVVKK